MVTIITRRGTFNGWITLRVADAVFPFCGMPNIKEATKVADKMFGPDYLMMPDGLGDPVL